MGRSSINDPSLFGSSFNPPTRYSGPPGKQTIEGSNNKNNDVNGNAKTPKVKAPPAHLLPVPAGPLLLNAQFKQAFISSYKNRIRHTRLLEDAITTQVWNAA